MELRKYIREMVEAELDEMARISTNIKIGDPEKAAIAKELYAGTWYGDMIDYVEESGATGIPQPELARMLGKSGQQAINPKVRDFLESNIFTKGELSIPKQEKPEASGIKGRPTSEKTLMAKDVNSKMEADGNYEPTEDELAMLGAEFVEKLRARVKGTLRRGRPAMPSKAKDGMMAAMKNMANAEDTDMDGDVDDEDLDDIAESTSINEIGRDNDKALGILFHSNDDEEEAEETPYIWDHDAYENLVKSMGYEDYKDVAGEMTHYFSPGDNDEMRVMKKLMGNPNLKPTDLTVGMYKKAIKDEYPDLKTPLNESFIRMQKLAGIIK